MIETKRIEIVAKFLEAFARKIEKESHILPMIPKDDKTWQGFVYDAQKLLKSLDVNAPMTLAEMARLGPKERM